MAKKKFPYSVGDEGDISEYGYVIIEGVTEDTVTVSNDAGDRYEFDVPWFVENFELRDYSYDYLDNDETVYDWNWVTDSQEDDWEPVKNEETSEPQDSKPAPQEPHKDRFERYGYELPDNSLSELNSFINLVESYDSDVSPCPVRCNMLMECEGDFDAKELSELFRYSIEYTFDSDKYEYEDGDFRYIPAEQLSELPEPLFTVKNGLLVVYNCETLNKNDWDNLIKRIDETPQHRVAAIGTAKFAEEVDQCEQYRRFFHCRVKLTKTDEPMLEFNKIADKLTDRLTVKEFSVSNDFKKGVVGYIKTEYPDSGLSAEEFVEKTANSILINFYKSASFKDKKILSASHIPPNPELILSQLDEMTGIEKVKKTLHDLCYRLQNGAEVMRPLNFIFYGNPGVGKAKVYKLTNQLLDSFREEHRIEVKSVSDYNSFKNDPDNIRSFPYQLEFENFTEEEMLQLFLSYCKKDKITLSEKTMELDGKSYNAEKLLLSRFEEEKADPSFANAANVRIIYDKLKKALLQAKSSERVFTLKMILDLFSKPKNGIDLSKMPGMKKIQEQLDRFGEKVLYAQKLKALNINLPASRLHMIFTGNPGTGKTTVAKKIADYLKEKGVIKTSKLVIKERKDLVAEHIGGTAPKTQKAIDEAMDGVLFIDEAYSLAPNKDGARDFGQETIATLITAMEEHRDRLVVIFAGYKEEMKQFRALNPGIDSRIGYTFHFEDYDTDELVEIFKTKIDHYRLKIGENVLEKVSELMEVFRHKPGFGNGRFVENVLDMALNNRAERYSKQLKDNVKVDKDDLMTITADDIPTKEKIAEVSPDKDSIVLDGDLSKEEKVKTAYHEVGHLLVGRILDSGSRLKVMTMNANAVSLGHVEYDMSNTVSHTESQLKARLAMCFGGRNAERLIYGEHDTGCGSDMEKAKSLAGLMVDNWAMGELGVTTVTDLLQEADRTAAKVLTENRELLEKITQILIDKGTLAGDELEEILKENGK